MRQSTFCNGGDLPLARRPALRDAPAVEAPEIGACAVAERAQPERTQVHDVAIRRRKELLGFDGVDAQRLEQARALLLPELDPIIAEFHRRRAAVPGIALVGGDSETMARLCVCQREYLESLFCGKYGADYVDHRVRIGLDHRRLGVEPKHYLAAVRNLLEILRTWIVRKLGDIEAHALLESLEKLVYFDVTCVFDTHLRSLQTELEAVRERTQRHERGLEARIAERTRELERLSFTDSLTGLANRRALMAELRRELSRAHRAGQPLAVLFLDLDGFKTINDARGHACGDQHLARVGAALRTALRDSDTAARIGGDEFCVLLIDTDFPSACGFRRRLQAYLHKLGIEASIGVAATGPVEFIDCDALLNAADGDMYAQKSLRRDDAARPEPAVAPITRLRSGARA